MTIKAKFRKRAVQSIKFNVNIIIGALGKERDRGSRYSPVVIEHNKLKHSWSNYWINSPTNAHEYSR